MLISHHSKGRKQKILICLKFLNEFLHASTSTRIFLYFLLFFNFEMLNVLTLARTQSSFNISKLKNSKYKNSYWKIVLMKFKRCYYHFRIKMLIAPFEFHQYKWENILMSLLSHPAFQLCRTCQMESPKPK